MFQNKATAEEIARLMARVGVELDRSIQLVKTTESDTVFREYRNSVSKLLTTMLVEIMNPLYEHHPELKPPELR